ncbi:MAG: exodeoxyribonuclease VII large subunit [Anaerolineae bacterium]|nr:exodeoxyribonuclease VII large subunit [Anaerolineae bacterium]
MELADVCAALEEASPDQLFTTRGRVVEVRRVRRSCYFTLADWDERLPCALLRHYAAGIGFWVRVGQVVEVTGHAEQFRGQWQLFVTAARLIEQLVLLREVSAFLETALPDRLFTTRGKVVEVHRVRRSCYFTLADGDARLHCALLRRNAMRLDFWVSVGQEVEVAGCPENFRDRWQLYVLEARLERGDHGWPSRFRYRSARRVVMAFDTLLDALFRASRG